MSEISHGKRLVVSLIDQYSKDTPERVWASIPQDESNLAKGFKDVSYRHLANAVNHASWWLDAALGKSNGNFETFAYAGPKDLRFPILALAAVKVGRQVRWILIGQNRSTKSYSGANDQYMKHRFCCLLLLPREKLNCMFWTLQNARHICIHNR